jgi:ABC-type sugar transport system substrate-binding protein
LLIGVDSGAAQITKNANARKIPVINVQRDVPGDVVSFVGSDNVVSGEAMMQWWADHVESLTNQPRDWNVVRMM